MHMISDINGAWYLGIKLPRNGKSGKKGEYGKQTKMSLYIQSNTKQRWKLRYDKLL